MINLIFEICKKGRRGESEIHLDRRALHCNFKKGGSSTTVQSYQPTPEERRLMDQAANYSEAVMPNALRLNTTARDLLWDSLGSNQVDFNSLNNKAQSQIANATAGLTDMIAANNTATNVANAQMAEYTPQFQFATNVANGRLGALAPQYQAATSSANSTLGSLAPQYMSAANYANYALDSLTPQYQAATSSANSTLGSLAPQYMSAANSVNNALGSYAPQYQSVSNAANGQLASLANGVLPTAYQENMENSIRSGLTNTMGNTVNNLGQRGVLNSSVTNTAMNDISRNAADALAQQYQGNINLIGNLTQQQVGNANTALGAQTDLAQQQLGNVNAALGAQGELSQQQLGNTSAMLGAQGDIAERQLGHINAALGAQGELSQQQLGNTSAMLGAQGELAQQQLGNTNNSLESQLGVSQNMLSNTMNTNQFNTGLLGSLIDSASTPITVAAAGQEAAQQPALNLWNASVGLNQGGTGTALAGVSGKGTTTTTQSNPYQNGWLSGVGGLFSGIASVWCFGADTLIKMADGAAKYIQDVVKGDRVVCPHADGTETEEEVLEVMEPHHADVYAVTATDDSGDYHVAFATSTQPILCADGTFVTVGNMKPGKKLHGGLELVSVEYDEFCEVYDLKVSGENNYYADGFAAKGGTVEW